jgi:hypothetical protein
MAAKHGQKRNPQTALIAQSPQLAVTQPVSKFDAAVELQQARQAAHAATAQYAVNVLHVLELAGPRIARDEAERIRRAVLDAFRIEGLAFADATAAAEAALESEADG